MLPRRRRTGSENEPQILIGNDNYWSNSKPKTINQINSVYPNNVTTEYYLDEDYIEDYTEPELVMTAKDRTTEFVNTIQTLQGRNIARAVAARDPKKSWAIQSHSEFMLIAKNVGKNIASTYTKLEKLTLLAKRKSLFDDRTAEIQELTYIIKSDLSNLNQQIAQLQDVSKKQRQGSGGKHLQSHSSSVVLALQSKLASMSTDFKQVLEIRTENLRHQKNRRDQFSQGGLPPPNIAQPAQGSLLLQDEDRVTIDLENTALLPRGQTQMQAALMYDQTDNYLQSRAETMQNIESTIVELGGIFQQLAHMVKEQDEMVERIDTNIEHAEMNIEAAHGQIVKYFKSISSNRWLMIKIFGVLILFFIVFVVFLA
ncbi:syntaxin-5 [Diorhabda carinulata]|uniref:syntaxin-5 n=1 Tax=Diorhabda sublineata TaxID=1163346 RepID=UPI0024E043E9|nr:syntaxin-5 [Diorhabda sublineata]XP_057663557.1 syntaxin-5 [Diorhabda carinulata]